jgi:hypothetical protein
MFEGTGKDEQVDYYVTLHNINKGMVIYRCEDTPPHKTTPTTFITNTRIYADANRRFTASMVHEPEYMLYNVHNLSGRLLRNTTGLSQLQETLNKYTLTKDGVETINEQLTTYVYRDIGADVMIVHIRHPIDPKVLYTGVVARTEEGARKAYQTYFDIKKGTLTVTSTDGNSKESWGRIARRPIDP